MADDAFAWDDLRLFLDVARLGGLSPATVTTGLSAATLGRRVTALEHHIGEESAAVSDWVEEARRLLAQNGAG